MLLSLQVKYSVQEGEFLEFSSILGMALLYCYRYLKFVCVCDSMGKQAIGLRIRTFMLLSEYFKTNKTLQKERG